MATITVIGLGSMGMGMAQSLLRAGHVVHGLDISEARMAAFQAEGGAAGSVAEAAAASDVLVCVVLAWKGAELVAKNLSRNDYDVRAYYTPKWMLTLAFPISFGFMAIEFARFAFGPRMLLSGQAGIHE